MNFARSTPSLCLAAVGLAFSASFASAQVGYDEPTVSSVQSPAQPFGLTTVGPVYVAGSDADAAQFQQESLPVLLDFISTNLGESRALQDLSAVKLDPNALLLQTESEVRVYFLGEGAGYSNTLGYNTDGTGVREGDPLLIFPNASSYVTYYQRGATLPNRTSGYPLLPGDFVDLGTYAGGTFLDFFLIANGANGGTNVWTADPTFNTDRIQHMVAFAVPDSPYLLLGFEDLAGGGDKDYNDLLFVVDIGAKNVERLVQLANPEPSTILMLLVASGLVWFVYRRPTARKVA